MKALCVLYVVFTTTLAGADSGTLYLKIPNLALELTRNENHISGTVIKNGEAARKIKVELVDKKWVGSVGPHNFEVYLQHQIVLHYIGLKYIWIMYDQKPDSLAVSGINAPGDATWRANDKKFGAYLVLRNQENFIWAKRLADGTFKSYTNDFAFSNLKTTGSLDLAEIAKDPALFAAIFMRLASSFEPTL